jgi:hypothetical protein
VVVACGENCRVELAGNRLNQEQGAHFGYQSMVGVLRAGANSQIPSWWLLL